MAADSMWRGHKIYYDDLVCEWRYVSDGALVGDAPERACRWCGRENTPEGHDACLGTLPGVMNACCGHGGPESYIQFENGIIVRGFHTVEMSVLDEDGLIIDYIHLNERNQE